MNCDPQTPLFPNPWVTGHGIMTYGSRLPIADYWIDHV